MQYFIKVKFRRLLAVIGHCRASIDYKIRKHYSTRFGILLRTIDEPSWVDIFCYQTRPWLEKISLWTKRCAAFGHTVWGCYYINFGGKLIYTARLWARILRALEAIWAAILAQMPQNFSHMYLHMSSNRYVSRFYEQSSRWPKLMTINSTAQPIETHRKLAGVFP